MVFIRKNSKGHNSVKMYVELQFFFSANCLMVVHICAKFHENILNSIKVIEQDTIFIAKISKGHNSVKCR